MGSAGGYASLAIDAVALPEEFARFAKDSPDEPHRQKMLVIGARVAATRAQRADLTYHEPAEMLADLKLAVKRVAEGKGSEVDAGNVREALIEDREQQLRLTLENPITPEEGAEETDQLLAKYPERAADQIFDRVAAAEPTEEELRAAYDAAFGADKTPKEEYSASHILVKTEEEAKAIADELAKGADFGKLAEEKSTDNSGANKGDLGWFTPDMMVKPFADAVVALKKGEVSAPVQSQFGWHVIKLIDERTQAAPAFDEVRDELATQVRRDRVAAEIERIAAAAKVEKTEGLDPALLGSTDITKN